MKIPGLKLVSLLEFVAIEMGLPDTSEVHHSYEGVPVPPEVVITISSIVPPTQIGVGAVEL